MSSHATVLSIDRAYFEPARVLLRSLVRCGYRAEDAIVALLPSRDQHLARAVVATGNALGLRVDIRGVRWDGVRPHRRDHPSPATYFRLLAPQICPEFSRLLYLDADVIALSDPRELLETSLHPHCIGAVRDWCMGSLADALRLGAFDESAPDSHMPYFNAGVLAIDCDRWRSTRANERVVAFAEQWHGRLKFHDQDVLNVLFAGEWKQLDPHWNVFALRELQSADPLCGEVANMRRPDIAARERDANVLHFATALKPWRPDFPPGLNRDRYQAFGSRDS